MLAPEYLRDLPAGILELYAGAELRILADMARRLMKYDYWIPAAEHQRRVLQEAGRSQNEILDALSEITGKSDQELRRMMQEASEEALKTDAADYAAAGLNPPAIRDSAALRKVLNAGYQATKGTMHNLTKSTAQTASRQFERALDRVWLEVKSGGADLNSAVGGALRELSEQGIRAVQYPSGRTDTIEVAVRRAAVTGVNQTALQLQDQLAEEVGCDLVETTAHAGARPEHALWQGKIFSRSGKSAKYPSLREGTGYGTGAGLGGWNCRHSFHPYIEGSPRAYTDKQLQDLNAPKYDYDGKKLTEYEASQIQRYNERQIRRWEREHMALEAAGLDTSEADGKLLEWRNKQEDFLRQTGLKRQFDRERTYGTTPKEAARLQELVNKQELAKRAREAYNKNAEEIRNHIRSNEVSKELNTGSQNKHIKESKGYIPGRSYIYGNLDDAQALVNQFHGTGDIVVDRNGNWKNKEIILTDRQIGVNVDPESGEETETRRFVIHYGKKGTHVVPAKEKK